MRSVAFVFIMAVFMTLSTAAKALEAGDAAPDFTLTDQDHQPRTLSTMRGKWLVLYFYPKDDTPGCTTEACNFRDSIVALQNHNAVVWGISVDSNESHAEFAEKYKLPFPLLADPGGKVSAKYNALLNLFVTKIAKRHTFIIGPDGKIAKVFRKVDPQTHAQDVIKTLQALQLNTMEKNGRRSS